MPILRSRTLLKRSRSALGTLWSALGTLWGALGPHWGRSKSNHGGGIMKEEASGSIRGYLGGIWEASRGIWKHLKTSGDIQGPCDPES